MQSTSVLHLNPPTDLSLLLAGIRQQDGAIDPQNLLPVSRAGGITYLRSNQGFELPRPTWKEEQERPEVKDLLDGQKL